MRRTLFILLLVLVTICLGGRPVGVIVQASPNLQAKPINPKLLEEVKAYQVVDGDTAYFDLGSGKSIKARLLLIDTPELHHPRLGQQPYGLEAKQRFQHLLQQAHKIEVEYDIGTHKDKYQRDLIYVWIDGQLVQEILVSEGLAQVAYVYPPNTRYLNYLEASQKEAKEAKVGLWSLYGSER